MSFGSTGSIGCVRFKKKSTTTFYAPHVARTALGVGFRTSFGDRNRNRENTPDMSFGSNRVDWVRSLRKNQLRFFFAPQVSRTVLGVGFHMSFGDGN